MQRDEGSTHVLEAVIIATIMVSAVAFVVSYDVVPPATLHQRDIVTRSAQDALDILYDMPAPAGVAGDNRLSYGLLACLQSNCSALTSILNNTLPKGASYAVYLSNGQALLPVYVPREPAGEAVTVRHLLEPSWSYTFLSTGINVVDGHTDPLRVVALPVLNSHPLTNGGLPVRVTMYGVRQSDGSDYTMRGSLSIALPAVGEPASTTSLAWIENGGATSTLDARLTTVSGGVPTLNSLPLRLRLSEASGGLVPADATLTVRVPRGWNATAEAGANPGWTIVSNADDASGVKTGSAIVARLNASLSRGSIDLALNATYHGDANDAYTFFASMQRGASAQAPLYVTADAHGGTSETEPPQMLVGAPGPMGPDGALWSLVATMPDATVGLDSVDVQQIVIATEDGSPLFAGFTPMESAGGAWTTNASTLTWTGSQRISQTAPLNLQFTASRDASATTPAAKLPFSASVMAGGAEVPLPAQSAPGLYHADILPQTGSYAGYDASTGSALFANHTFSASADAHGIALPGVQNYTVGPAAGLRNAFFGSGVTVLDRTTTPGGQVHIEVDAQSMLSALATLGVQPVVTLSVYPPWSGNSHEPAYQIVLYDGNGVQGQGQTTKVNHGQEVSSNVSNGHSRAGTGGNGNGNNGQPAAPQSGEYDVNITIPSSWLFGPYVVETQVSWTETDTGIVAGSQASQAVLRTASFDDYFNVAMPNGQLPLSPIYDVHLVAWFDDWR